MLATARANRERLPLTATVTAEAGYLLDSYGGPRIEARFLRGVGAGEFEVVDLTPEDYTRMGELVEQYADLRLGSTDASVIALAERLGVHQVATIDRRHFPAVRPRHGPALTLLPENL
jgi:predicted nucleic acid-binding protein